MFVAPTSRQARVHRLLALLVVILATLLTSLSYAAPVVTPGTSSGGGGGSSSQVTVVSAGDGITDDGPAIRNALTRCSSPTKTLCQVHLSPARTWTIKSMVYVPCHASLWLHGSRINSAVPINNVDSTFQSGGGCGVAAQQAQPLTMAETAVVGSDHVVVTNNPGLVAGDWLVISLAPPYYAGQSVPMSAITGSGPYTIWFGEGRRVAFAYPTGGGVNAYANAPIIGARIHGGGATITATALSGRCVEMPNCQDCLVEDLTCRGPFNWMMSWDVLSHNSTIRNVRAIGDEASVISVADNGSGLCRVGLASPLPSYFVTGTTLDVSGIAGATACNGVWPITRIDSTTIDLQGSAFAGAYTRGGLLTYTSSGVVLENCEGCLADGVMVSGVGVSTGGAGAGYYVYNSPGSVSRHIQVSGCAGAVGALLEGPLGPWGSESAVLEDSVFRGCATGVSLLDHSSRWRIARTHVENASAYGYLLTTATTGAPYAASLDDVSVSGADVGVMIDEGDATSLTNSRISGARIGLQVGLATGTRVTGGWWEGNATAALFGEDVELTGTTLRNNGDGILASGNIMLAASNVSQIVNDGNAAYHGWYNNGAGTWSLSNCTFDVRGSTGVKIGVLVESSANARVDAVNFRALGDSGSSAYSFFVNGNGKIRYASLFDTTTNHVSGSSVATSGWTELH